MLAKTTKVRPWLYKTGISLYCENMSLDTKLTQIKKCPGEIRLLQQRYSGSETRLQSHTHRLSRTFTMSPCLLPLLLFSASSLSGKCGLKANNTHKFHKSALHEKTERNLQQTPIVFGFGPCPSKWHMLHNHKIASGFKKQFWASISVTWLYCLYFYCFSNLSHIGLGIRLGCIFIYHHALFFYLCIFVYFGVGSFYNPLGFFFYLFCIIFLFYLFPHVHINKAEFSTYWRAG